MLQGTGYRVQGLEFRASWIGLFLSPSFSLPRTHTHHTHIHVRSERDRRGGREREREIGSLPEELGDTAARRQENPSWLPVIDLSVI